MYFFSSRTKKVESTWASFENNSPTDGSTCTFWESFPHTFYTTQTALLKGQKAPATLRSRCKICSIALCCHRADRERQEARVCKETRRWDVLSAFLSPALLPGCSKGQNPPPAPGLSPNLHAPPQASAT